METTTTALTPAPEGRIEVEGVVTGMKQKHRDWKSPHGWKFMVTTDAGWRVWVTRPRPFDGGITTENADPDWKLYKVAKSEGGYDDPECYPILVTTTFPVARGDRVRFTATLTRSNDDPALAWGNKPTNPVIVERTTEPTTLVPSENLAFGAPSFRRVGEKIMVNPYTDAVQALADLAAAEEAYKDWEATADGTEDLDTIRAMTEPINDAQHQFQGAIHMANIDRGPSSHGSRPSPVAITQEVK